LAARLSGSQLISILPFGLKAARCERKTIMSREFECFCDLHGQPTTSMGVPYNELFSTEEIRRLKFTRFLAVRNQELSPLIGERKMREQRRPADNSLMTVDTPMSKWMLLGVKLFWYPPLAMTAILTNYSQLPLHGLWFSDIP
jgi:hypothetical protein